MHPQPAVSVIIPVYNAERFLPEALDSVLAQTLPAGAVEIIAVDDGSTDGSAGVLERYASAHPSLRVISIPNSGSAARPRNLGIDSAVGRYLFFLDADDLLDPDALRSMVAMADETGSGVVLCKMGALGDRPIPRAMFASTRRRVDFVECGAYQTLGPWKLFRRSLVEESGLRFASGFRLGEDRPFVMAAYLRSPHVSVLADRVYYWLRARDDGANTTTAGQPPRAHLEANIALAEVIAGGTEPGRRREILLARPVVGPGGFRATFGRAFRTMTEQDQVEAIDRARAFIAPLWTPGLRDRGSAEAQILLELVLAGDRESLLRASGTLADGRPLPLVPDDDGFVFEQQGTRIGPLSAQLAATLDDVSFSDGGVRLAGRAWGDGVTRAPDAVAVVWVHRRSSRSVTAVTKPAASVTTDRGAEVAFDAVISPGALGATGDWDAFVEARWGSVLLRERWGRARSERVDPHTVLFGGRPLAALTFTEFGNLTLDVGPVHTYDDVAAVEELEVGAVVRVARRPLVVVLAGPHGAVRARMTALGGGRVIDAELRPISDTLSLVIASRPARRGRYRLVLTGPGGPAVAQADISV